MEPSTHGLIWSFWACVDVGWQISVSGMIWGSDTIMQIGWTASTCLVVHCRSNQIAEPEFWTTWWWPQIEIDPLYSCIGKIPLQSLVDCSWRLNKRPKNVTFVIYISKMIRKSRRKKMRSSLIWFEQRRQALSNEAASFNILIRTVANRKG